MKNFALLLIAAVTFCYSNFALSGGMHLLIIWALCVPVWVTYPAQLSSSTPLVGLPMVTLH